MIFHQRFSFSLKNSEKEHQTTAMKILICSDGSAQANQAIQFGGLIAAACHADTTLLGITEKNSDEEVAFEALKQGSKLLKESSVSAELILKSGEPGEEIVRRTEETKYDLVVIGASKKGTRGAYLLSAKAYKIIKAVEPPVLVVIGQRVALKQILICSGGEKYIDTAVRFAGEMAKNTGAKITLFHVMAEPPADFGDLIKMEEDVNLLLHSNLELGQNLRNEKELLEKLGVESRVRLRHGLVLSEILKEIKRDQYDLVVTGSSPASGNLRSYILGNITREIVNRSECPVLVVRGEQTPEGLGSSLKGFFSEVFGQSKS
jgi:nucleotide-binding universal stress UspA family protein